MQALAEEPRQRIGGAARRKRYDHGDGTRGIILGHHGSERRSAKHGREQRGEPTSHGPSPNRGVFERSATPPPYCMHLNKSLNGLHNPVTLHVVCQYMLLRSVYWRP